MKTLLSFLILAVIISFVISKKPEDPSKGVIDVTSANQDTVFAKDVDALVEFYAPWCGHCKTLAPEYAKAGEAFDKVKPEKVILAKVDCTKESGICQKFGVKGYPTLKFFPKGKTEPEDYQGGRTADDILKFINEKAGTRLSIPKEPTFVPELDESDFDKVALAKGKTALVMFYAPWCGHCKTLKPTYEKLGKVFDSEENVVIAKVDATKSRSLGERYGVKGYPTLKWITADNKVVDANVGRSLDKLVDYVNEKSGTFRTVDGLLNDKAGLHGALSDIAAKFVSAAEDARKKLLDEAEELVEKLPANFDKKQIGYYVRTMKKVAAKGKDYVDSETKRLSNLLKSSSVSQKFLDSFKKRLNILSKFK